MSICFDNVLGLELPSAVPVDVLAYSLLNFWQLLKLTFFILAVIL